MPVTSSRRRKVAAIAIRYRTTWRCRTFPIVTRRSERCWTFCPVAARNGRRRGGGRSDQPPALSDSSMARRSRPDHDGRMCLMSHAGGGVRQQNVIPTDVFQNVSTMDVTAFDAERPRLTAIAIRILGSEADASDVLQEAWLRLARTDAIDDPPAWLTTVVTRLCLDQLRKRRTRSDAEAEAPSDPVPVDPEADTL